MQEFMVNISADKLNICDDKIGKHIKEPKVEKKISRITFFC